MTPHSWALALATSSVNAPEVVLLVAGVALLAAIPWILARRGTDVDRPNASQPPFALVLARALEVMLLFFGIGNVIGGNESAGVGEILFGLLIGVSVVAWARRHPGYRLWRWQPRDGGRP